MRNCYFIYPNFERIIKPRKKLNQRQNAAFNTTKQILWQNIFFQLLIESTMCGIVTIR